MHGANRTLGERLEDRIGQFAAILVGDAARRVPCRSRR